MRTEEFVAYLHSLDVKIWAEGDRLRCNAPGGVLTPALRGDLALRKAELLKFLSANKDVGPGNTALHVSGDRDKDFPLSFPQQRLWILDQLSPGSSTYNIPGAVWFKGCLDVEVLERAIVEIVHRHEALRTTFASVDRQPVQRISAPQHFGLTVTDLQSIPEDVREGTVNSLLVAEAKRPFDLERGPLFRFSLYELSAQEYVLLSVTHHIVSDGWSIGVFTRELTALYRAFLESKPSPLPKLQVQYADFAQWQRNYLQGKILEGLLGYWREQLGGDLPVLELPADHPRPVVQSYRGASQIIMLPETLHHALVTLSRKQGATLFMTLLAAFKALLYRYTGQEDIVLGTPVANRDHLEIEGLIGFFVNMLVLRTKLSGTLTFSDLLKQVRNVSLGAFAHRDLPFELLVESLQPKRDVSRSPLFQVLFALQNAPTSAIDLPGLTMSPLQVDNASSKYDLGLYLWEVPEGLAVYCEYSTDLFDQSTILRMLGHYQGILESIAANPDQQLWVLPLLSEAERRQLLVEWNAPRLGIASLTGTLCKGVHNMIEEQVERTPEAIAVVCGDRQLTYRELDCHANQLAHYLRKLGVGTETLVGVCAERSLEMVVAVLGVLKSGGAYVPLDPAYPRERLAYMLDDAGVSVLLTQRRLVDLLSGHSCRTVCLDDDWDTIAQECAQRQDSGISPDQCAYVIYTSGSTGRPKGVQVVHSALANFLASMRQEPGLTAADTLLAVTTLSFDIAGLELYLPLTVGARVVVADVLTASDGSRLAEAIETYGVTVMQATPATWQILFSAGWQGNKRLKILCGGEALSRELAKRLLDCSSSVWNLYGPTETTVWSAVERVETGNEPVPIGRPIANTQLYILDSHLQPVPIGVSGELYIGGAGLARGYLNRPELTAERFVQDPFSPDSLARMYRTGDLARFLPDGRVKCLGRVDHQVKVRGFRIELGEIEAVLVQHPGIRQAVAWVREDQPGDKRLVAYLIPDHQPPPSVTELRSALKERLPDYMVPSAFVFMDAFPLTPNGKVNRRALPTPDNLRPELEAAYAAPQTDMEQAIAAIWQDVLRVERVGTHDNFFDLGGNSLLIVQAHSELQDRYGNNITVADMFKYPTIAALTEYLKDGHETHGLSPSAQERIRRQQEARRQAQDEALRHREQLRRTDGKVR